MTYTTNGESGNIAEVITVTAVRADGARAAYANYGDLVDLAAPALERRELGGVQPCLARGGVVSVL